MTDSHTPHTTSRRAALLALAGVAASGDAVAAGLKFWPFDRRSSRKPLLIAGAHAMFALNQSILEAFKKAHSNIDVVLESGASLSALIALKRGSVDIAVMSRDLKTSEDENGLRNYLVARNGVAIAVGPGIRLANLRGHQVRAMLSGEVSNWSQVGGPNAPVRVVSRLRGSVGREFVESFILEGSDIAATAIECDSARKLTQMVASTPYAIGFISIKDKLTAVPVGYIEVDGVQASRETMLSGRYPYTQSLYLVTMSDHQQTTAKLFVDFVRSAAGQALVDAAGMVGTY